MRRCSAEQAHDIAYRKMNGSDVLMFPIGKEIGMIDRLESLTVELQMEGYRLRAIPPGGRSTARRRAVSGGEPVPGGGADRRAQAD